MGGHTVYPKKCAHGYCFAVLCCGYTLTDFPISIRLTSLALWQSNDCPSASKATLMDMEKYFMWIHYERLHNHNKAKHNNTVCIFLGVYCTFLSRRYGEQQPCTYSHMSNIRSMGQSNSCQWISPEIYGQMNQNKQQNLQKANRVHISWDVFKVL